MIESSNDHLANPLRVGQPALALVEGPLHLPVVVTGAPHLIPPFLLQERAGPLHEITAPVVLGVPRPRINVHLFRGRILLQVLAEVDGRKPKRSRSKPIQDGPIEEPPEAALNLRRAKPAAVLAIRPGSHQRREIAMRSE